MNFEEMLKKQKESSLDTIVSAANAEKENPYNNGGPDERIWKPTLDKAGNGFAILRFLPAPDTDIPWKKFYTHGFKGETGRWFIENCLTSIGKDCPVCNENSKLWNSGIESNKDIVRARKRRMHYISNVLVIRDPENKENEGKVYLYKYGAKIFSKIMERLQPVFEDEEPIDPFNLLSGVNFKMKIKQVGGYWNYDSSEFESSPSALFDGDEEKLKVVFNSLHSISEFTDPSEYKSYDELEKKMRSVLDEDFETDDSSDNSAKSSSSSSGYRSESSKYEIESVSRVNPKSDNSSTSDDDNDDDDDDMAYFKRLAQSM